MDILISHNSALELIRTQKMRLILEDPQRCDAYVPSLAPNEDELAALLDSIEPLAQLTRPIEVLVSDRGARRRSKLVKTRLTAGPLPSHSAILVAPNVFCVAPEHLAVQLAPQLTELELIVLLSELLGTYTIAPGLEEGMYQRSRPATTRESIVAHLEALGSRPGTAGVRNALRHACAGSGSPRETKLSLRLGLKPARGGYGLDVLSMNEPLEVRRIHNRMRAGVRKPDILLRAPAQATRNGQPLLGAAVEYDGKDHASEEAHARDAERHNELTAIGLVEYIVTKRQYRDLSYMDGLVDLIRRDLGIPAKRRTRAEAARLRRLRQRLYEELERIDGVHWDGRERRRAGQDGSRHDGWDVVPVEAYGLG